MPIKVTCNSCGGVLHAPDDSAGKRGRCPTCGMILSIPADAPRVPAEPVPAPAPTAASATYGLASNPDLAFPKPPLFGDDTKTPHVAARSSMATASRLPPDPRRFGDPFAKPGKTPQAAASDALARRWSRVYRGLGLDRLGLFFAVLAIILPSVVTLLEKNGVALPEKDPGMLGVAGLTQLNELRIGLALVFALLAGLCVVFGRFGVAAVPRESGAKGLAFFAALASLFAFFGMLAVLVYAIGATMNQAPPQVIPNAELQSPGLKAQTRFEDYCHGLFLGADESTGQIQRFGALAFIVCGIIAECWFLGALGRLAVHLRSERAAGRVTRLVVLCGLAVILTAFAWLYFDLLGREWFYSSLKPKWIDLNANAKATARAGICMGVALVAGFLGFRVIGGVRRAIREASTT